MDQLLSFLKEFDIANLLPEAEVFLDQFRLNMALITLLGPVLLIGLGAWYFFCPREQVGDPLGFRGLIPIREQSAWLYSQRLAGIGYGLVGIATTVVFGILCLFFGAMAPMTVATCAFVCVIIELLLTLTVWLGVPFLTRKEYQI